jgi:ABC-type lipoprotein release transport system permease subunit
MLTLRLAWRSFLRHRRRSLITGIAIALGLAMMIVFVGLAGAAHVRMADQGIRMGAGHVVVQGLGYQDQQTLDELVEHPADVIAAARAIPGVRTVAPRLHASGLISSGDSSAAVAVVGVDPAIEPIASDLASERKRVAGAYLRPRAELPFANGPADVYIGAGLAETMALEVGDRVVVSVSPRGGGRPASAAFQVRGVFRSGLQELDGFYVEIPLDEARALLGTGEGVTQVALLLDDLEATGRVAAMRERVGDDLEVLPWQTALRELHEAIVLDDAGMYLMMAIIFVIVAIGIFNTVLMSVIERTRELGVMMAIGTSKRRLFGMVLAEALVLGAVAAVVGLAIALPIHAWLASSGLDISALYGDDLAVSGVLINGRIYSQLELGDVVQWTAVVIGIVVVSALYPAYRVTRLSSLEAMRHV